MLAHAQNGSTLTASRGQKSPIADTLVVILAGMIFLLGGGGMTFPLVGAVVQTSSILVLCVALFGFSATAPRVPLAAQVVIICVGLVIALQLVPLPGDGWQKLPGRELASEILGAVGAKRVWPSLSLDPNATATAALELLPALAIFIAALRGGLRTTNNIIGTFVAVAFVSLCLAGLQRISHSGDLLFPYGTVQYGSAPGIFVNRNHQASFLLLAIPFSAYLITNAMKQQSPRRQFSEILGWGLIILFALGVIATASRAGLLLLPIALAAAAMLMLRRQFHMRTVIGGIGSAAILVAAVSQSSIVDKVLERFSGEANERSDFWAVTLQAAKSFWPLGSGIGTFPQIYPIFEPHQQLSDAYVNNAHNDYVELLMEGGILSLLAALLVVGVIVYRTAKIGKLRANLPLMTAAFAGLVMILLHSIADYPARMMSIIAVLGLILAIWLGAGAAQPDEWRQTGTGKPSAVGKRRIVAAVVALACLVPVWATALAQRDIAAKRPAAALTWNPWSSEAMADAGYAEFEQGHHAAAAQHGIEALRLAPLNAEALALLVDVERARGDTVRADRLLDVAAKLGAREPHIQYALAARAAEREDDRAAVRHADALLRTGSYIPLISPFLRQLVPYPEANAAIVEALAQKPRWRLRFLQNLTDLPIADTQTHLQLLQGLKRTPNPPTRDEVDAFTKFLIAHSRYDEARAVAAEFTPAAVSKEWLNAETLSALDAAPKSVAPFSWQKFDVAGLEVEPLTTGGVAIRNRRSVMSKILSRLVVAPPGKLQLQAAVEEISPNSLKALSWNLRCTGSNLQLSPANTQLSGDAKRQTLSMTFDIPAQGCPAQVLEIGLDNSDGTSVDINLTKLTSS